MAACASDEVKAALAPSGVLRVGLNTANYLLVGSAPAVGQHGADASGVAPALGAELAKRLQVPVQYVSYKAPAALADDVAAGAWDVGFIGADPKREASIAFTAAYVEIPITYLTPDGSRLKGLADVDVAGTRIASVTGSAFDLWLARNIRQAEVVQAPTMDAALDLLLQGRADALAGMRDRLLKDVEKVPNGKILDGHFMVVHQAVGVARARGDAASTFLHDFVEEVKASGRVAALLKEHHVADKLLVAAPSGRQGGSPAKKPRLDKAAPMKVAILGCGAMGSIYAGLLASAGNDVWAVDVWREHVEAMRRDGLRVDGASGSRTVRVQATTDAADAGAGSVDLVIIATKASGVAAAAEAAARLLAPDGVILTIQNGLGAGDRIAKHAPPARVLLGIASNFGASMRGPGHAEHRSMNLICIGEMVGGMTERLQRIVDVWAAAGFTVKACENINQMIWEKFICNCTYSGSATLTGMTVGGVQDTPSAWAVALGCAREAYAVARAQGIPLAFDDVEEHVRKFGSTVRAAKPSMLQDHEARRRSEIDAINGAVAVEAAKVNMTAPVNETVANLVRAREASF